MEGCRVMASKISKRRPKLVDKFNLAIADPNKNLAVHGLWSNNGEKVARTLRPIMRTAVVFRLDEEVVDAACRLALDHPDVLAEMSRRARLPYDTVFLEWSNHQKLKSCEGRIYPTTPEHVGALLTREPGDTAVFNSTVISPSAEGDGGELIGMSPFSFAFNPDNDWGSHTGYLHAFFREQQDIREQLRTAGLFTSIEEGFYDHLIMDPFIYGSATWHHKEYEEAPLQWDAARSISRRTRLIWNPYEKKTMQEALESDEIIKYRVANWAGGGTAQKKRKEAIVDDLRLSYQEELGDAKLIIAIISLLSAGTKIVDWSDTISGDGSSFAGGRIVKYMHARVVKLKLPIKEVRRTLRAMAYKIKKRRHEVMGHWCSSHRTGDSSCSHKYEDIDPRVKVCSICKHRIWYKKDHMRGDASIGFVHHTYEVEKAHG